ncbi:toprim domain-containing protein [Mucilaginibacter terrae]|uniref:DNA primase n=1 Tax=Mucilaginibacter terrae TaxID=1955052 RepID=A0ABU3GUF7_9SPHI|nr:toprim domain-containing protein [Mucilaginibacter terrae]MDT3402275.1 hypothetical protein [Mucilaginibacter terrae]
MENMKSGLSIEELRNLDLVDYLASLGHQPEYVKKDRDFWYLSPLRLEGEASFKVNREINRWYDHGLGKGGNLIDFGLAYFGCNVRELMDKFRPGFSFQQHIAGERFINGKSDVHDSKITILSDRQLYAYPLINYLHERRIPVSVAGQFCREVNYQLDGRNYFGVGFKNDAGGYEIRNAFSKASSSPKDITRIGSGSDQLHVFEGFFDMLSFQTLYGIDAAFSGDMLVLNSAAFFERARPVMAEYPVKNLWLDHDTTGRAYTQFALSLKDGFIDRSGIYEKYKDLNDFLTGKLLKPKQQIGQKIS